jgi:hypothetical protein
VARRGSLWLPGSNYCLAMVNHFILKNDGPGGCSRRSLKAHSLRLMDSGGCGLESFFVHRYARYRQEGINIPFDIW